MLNLGQHQSELETVHYLFRKRDNLFPIGQIAFKPRFIYYKGVLKHTVYKPSLISDLIRLHDT